MSVKLTKSMIECVFLEVKHKEVTLEQGVSFIWEKVEKMQKMIDEAEQQKKE